jgi:hypothetical protein
MSTSSDSVGAPDFRAIGIGVVFYSALQFAFLFLEAQAERMFLPLIWLFFATPVLAGMVTGYLVRRRRLPSLLLEGAAISVCTGALHMMRGVAGLPGNVALSGTAALVLFCLLFVLPLVVVGGAIGASVAPKRG